MLKYDPTRKWQVNIFRKASTYESTLLSLQIGSNQLSVYVEK